MNIGKFVGRQRMRLQVGYNTIGVFGMGIVIAKAIQDILKGSSIVIDFTVLYLMGIAALWFGGYMWCRLGILGEEQQYYSENNPYFKEHMERKV